MEVFGIAGHCGMGKTALLGAIERLTLAEAAAVTACALRHAVER